jgi:CRISPR associated protein
MFSIQIDIDITAAARAVSLTHTVRHDEGMLIKTVLTETLGGAVVRPWSLHRQNGSIATILGYSLHSIEEINARLATALPARRSAIRDVYGHELPLPPLGARFRFSVRLCPTIHVTPSKDKSRAHGEQDAFLVAVSRGETGIEREAVYGRYLSERLHGARVEFARLTRFRLEKMTRPHRGASAPATGMAQRMVPDAVLEGIVTVTDPKALMASLISGAGRQRAYGRGYVRLEPIRVAAAA